MSKAPALAEPQKRNRGVVDLLRDPSAVKGLEAVATKYLTPDRMAKIAVNAIHRTPKLAECNPQTLLGAVMLSCSLGLEPNTPMGQAYLIPFDRRGKLPDGSWGVIGTDVNFIIGYKGYVALAKRNPKMVKLYAATVHENDLFEYMEGSESFLRFRPSMLQRGAPIGSFCFTKEHGEYGDVDASTVLPMEEIEKIRSCSETFGFLSRNLENADNDYKRKKAQEKLDDTPWVKWFGEMAAKSAIRRHVKQLDLTAHLAAAAVVDEVGETGRIDMSKMVNPDYTRAITEGETEPDIEPERKEEQPDRPALSDETSSHNTMNNVDGSKSKEREKVTTTNKTASGSGGESYVDGDGDTIDGDTGEVTNEDPKAAEKREKQNLAAYASEHGITLDLRKSLENIKAEVETIRDGSHPDLKGQEEDDSKSDQGGDDGFNFSS